MNKDELLNAIKDLESRDEELHRELQELCQQYAEMICLVKVGDIMVEKRVRKGRVPRRAVVTKIEPGYGYSYNLFGRWVLKDNEQGIQEHRLYDWDWELLTTE